jgi:glutamyl-tRNA synthetase
MRMEQKLRGERQRYDGFCMHLSAADVAAKEAAGAPHVVRMKVPRDGSVIIDDLRRGPIDIGWETVDMQVLMKSDGLPTYHLANVVDDHLMGITHVLRGEEWISSAPKHVLLYRYFGWEMPKLMHLPLLRNADRSKLSKRKNPTSILFYRAMGYLPPAMLNFLGLFALSSADGEEMATLDELVERFDLQNISLGGPVFDTAKLDWLNGRWIRERLDDGAFARAVQDWALNPDHLSKIAPLARTRIERLSDLGPLTSFFFAGRLDLPAERLLDGKVPADVLRLAFQLALWRFDALVAFDKASVEGVLRGLAEPTGAKFKDLVRHMYIAVTGNAASVPLFDAMALLGRDLVRERLRQALATLGGASKKELDAWKKLDAPAETGADEAESAA